MDQPVSPVAPPWRPSRRLGVVWATGAGVAALAALGLGGWAEPGPTLVAAALVAAAGALVYQRRAPDPEPDTSVRIAPEPRLAARPLPTAPVAEALEALNEPILVIAAIEPDDLIARQIVFANAAARELFRVPREGALLVKALRSPEVLAAVERALFGGRPTDTAFDPGGSQARALRACCAPLSAASGGPAGVKHAVLVFRDEADARRVRRMNADFLANASHELRTPLASLTGFIETLRGHAKDDPVARERFLAIMAAQADRMGRLVYDLLSLSRIELNEHVPPSGDANLAAVVQDVVDALSPQARAAGVEVRVDISGPTEVEGDRDQLIQVVQNLLDNALKYSPPGGTVRVEVSAGAAFDDLLNPSREGTGWLSLLNPDRRPGDRPFVAVRVSDQGPGIDREHLPRLTERFYRVEGQKSGDRLGTGLGLAIVKHIVNRHRGGMIVESRPGEGTTFTVCFPEPIPSTIADAPRELASAA